MQGARDELQQGGLAGAVAAHEADPLALVHRHRGAVEQQIALNAVFEIVNVQHGSALFRPEVPAGGDSMPGGQVKATAQRAPAAETRSRADPPARSEEQTSELQSLMRITYADFGWKKK